MCCRYALNEDQARDKERFISKEREEALRSARERKMADLKVGGLVTAVCMCASCMTLYNLQISPYNAGSLMQLYVSLFSPHNSSLEGATELKFAPFCSS